jgi:hypothetical protein
LGVILRLRDLTPQPARILFKPLPFFDPGSSHGFQHAGEQKAYTGSHEMVMLMGDAHQRSTCWEIDNFLRFSLTTINGVILYGNDFVSSTSVLQSGGRNVETSQILLITLLLGAFPGGDRKIVL